jgi:nitrite reductase/ring-hydroxylating ferredoxin subunit
MSERDLLAMIESIVHGRRPRPRRLDAEEARLAATAAALRAGRSDLASPDPGYVDDLARRLRRAADDQGPLSASGQRRRRFLAASGIAAAAAVVGIAGDRLVEQLQPSTPPPGADLVPETGAWHPVATMSQIADGSSLAFTARGVSGVVVRRGETVSALSAVCTHQGCILALDAPRSLLRCPCHSTNFGLDGQQVTGYYRYSLPPLPRLRAQVRGDSVEVWLPL